MELDEGIGASSSTGSLAHLYEGQRNRVFAVCFAMLHNAEDAEDATQETFVRVMARLETLSGDPIGYLVATARNVCVDELRRRVRRPGVGPGAAYAGAAGTTVEEAAIARDTVGLLWRDLPEADRRLFAHVFAGWSPREIGSRLGTSAGLVNLRIFRARQRIRRLVSTPAALANLHPHAVLEAVARRLRGLRSDTAPPLLAQLQTSTLATVPMLAAMAAGLLGGATPGALGTSAPAPAVAAAAGHADRPVSGFLRVPLAAARSAASAVAATTTVGSTTAPASLTSFTPSAHYNQDHVLYAQGPSSGQCSNQNGPCYSLYRTGNGGRSWALVSPAFSGRLLMPPGFPATPTLYSLRSDGLARSDDGGHTFALVTALVMAVRTGENQASSTRTTILDMLPPQVGAAVPDTAPLFGQANLLSSTVEGDAAAIDPTSTAADVRVFVVNRSLGIISLYDSASSTVEVDYQVAPDQDGVVNLFTAPGARGVFVVARTAPDGWSTFDCTAQAGCARLGPAAKALRDFTNYPTMSPTFGVDQTLWYAGTDDIDQVTMSGTGARRRLPADWYPMAVIPDANYATTRTLEVIAGGNDPSAYVVFRSVRGGPFAPVDDRSFPAEVNVASLRRLPDGSLIGTDWPWGDSADALVCSRDDARSWGAAC